MCFLNVKKFTVLSRARSGSEVLMGCIMQHPNLNVYGEIFNYYREENMFANPEGSEYLTREELVSICSKDRCVQAHSKYDGFKLLLCHLNDSIKEYLKEINVFTLYRRNLLQRYVSEMVARESNDWASDKDILKSIYIDVDDLKNDILVTKKWYKENDKNTNLKVYYEDGILNNAKMIFESLGVSEFVPKITNKKRILRPMSQVISNYDEVKHFDHANYF